MSDVVVYYCLVKQFDSAHHTGEYEKVYNNVVTYLPNLPRELQISLLKYLQKNIKPHSRNEWLKNLLTFSKSYKLSVVGQ